MHGARLSNEDAHSLFEALEEEGPGQFPAMVIAPLAGLPTSERGPIDPDNDADAASQRVSSLQVSQLSMRGSIHSMLTPSDYVSDDPAE